MPLIHYTNPTSLIASDCGLLSKRPFSSICQPGRPLQQVYFGCCGTRRVVQLLFTSSSDIPWRCSPIPCIIWIVQTKLLSVVTLFFKKYHKLKFIAYHRCWPHWTMKQIDFTSIDMPSPLRIQWYEAVSRCQSIWGSQSAHSMTQSVRSWFFANKGKVEG